MTNTYLAQDQSMTTAPRATRVCVLRTGGDYSPEHVQWLAQQIPGLVCLSDATVEGVPTIEIPTRWPGWWAKMHLFDPTLIAGDLLYFDLDTVVVGSLEGLDAGVTTLLSDFHNPALLNSSLMYITAADKEKVWKAWNTSPSKHMDRCRTRECWGDQGFLGSLLEPQRWQDLFPGRIVSYKKDCRDQQLPEGADIVCFHGEPRPWAIEAPWVPPFHGTQDNSATRYKPRRRTTLLERLKRLLA
ncbi:hypothetical protein [Halomonas binhaiensis]|uniref:Glycosyltransferase n=1 Tax=Halomonas binhaiensis TaxID=2562282 RepID=A0A7U3HWM6_9GAMM|nr:hypothetical protein [Halomonas binhaiensis]QRG26780.1 hypothetical protein E4T21_11060 [Halomonas binhaiensis]